ncbi:hypothetical protein T10_8800 [Trichinella papuae]|uniref:PiggyBac transposable element-derived protein domain-containing protein n=1 Tax=Trichinella papuae TaxID=268474 RepID=A0A0V1MFS0_9BILA|nr:hypothetical protein T10_8800 [Trichinella papuae]
MPSKYGQHVMRSPLASNMQVYPGKAPGATPENSQDMRVVLDMTKDKTNKPELPKELAVCTGRAKYSSSKSFLHNEFEEEYHPVQYYATHSKDSSRQDKKPDIIFATKGKLDNPNKVLLTYTSKIKTARCLVVTSANIIDDRNLQMIDSEQSVPEAVASKTFWKTVSEASMRKRTNSVQKRSRCRLRSSKADVKTDMTCKKYNTHWCKRHN